MEIDNRDGWRMWDQHYGLTAQRTPYTYGKVQIVRREWDEPRTVDPNCLPPEMNIIGLYWRPHA